MHLRQLQLYVYPLRTTLVYDVRLDGEGGYEVTRLDEMWSFGDLLANLPVLGEVYDAGRRAWGHFFERTFRVSRAIATRPRPSLLGGEGEPE